MNINFNRLLVIKYVVHLLIMIFIAKLIGLSLWFFLPKESINVSVKTDFVMPYMRYSIDDFRLKASKIKATVDRANALSIDSIILKAIYKMNVGSLVVVVPKNNKAKSKTIGIGDVFGGYTLKKVFSEYVIFEKNYKEYRLYITKPKIDKRWKNIQANPDPSGEYVRRVSSSDVKQAIANPGEIWKNIGLQPHLSKGKANGFKVSFVRKGTVFDALGLKVGDVIQGVNNKELKNNAQAFSAYQELKNVKALKLSILRGKTPMELEYEIY